VVVPLMIFFSVVMVWQTWGAPEASNWIVLESGYNLGRIWFAPLLYAAFNLAMAQAVLVPLAVRIKERSVLIWGGVWGGAGIGLMLLAGHFALSARMPDIARFDIPMGQLLHGLGYVLPTLF